MTRIIMHGCNGKMGQVITGLCKEDADVEHAYPGFRRGFGAQAPAQHPPPKMMKDVFTTVYFR